MTTPCSIYLRMTAGTASGEPQNQTDAQPPLCIHADKGQTLAQAIWLSGFVTPPPLCSALGRCGRCRVRFLSPAPPPVPAVATEQQLFSAEELTAGWRLACRHTVEELGPAVELELPAARTHQTIASTAASVPLVLAVDLGTTSLHWRAVRRDGTVAAQGQEINPQMGAGSDIMSRLAAARRPGGMSVLSQLVTNRLQALVQALPQVDSICLAANTAMTAIVLQKDISGLAGAPYALPLGGDSVESLPGLPPMYIPPQLSPFVGGDLSAGFAALHRQGMKAPFLLADMGTNGEFILHVNPEETYMASVPLGPALEGIGLTFGDMAGSGSGAGIVNAVQLTPLGLQASTVDGQPPHRLCAAGYLSLIRALLQAGLLREDGTFCTDPPLPYARKLAARLIRVGTETRLPLWADVYLTGDDVEEILKVKAAFSLAFAALLEAAQLPASALRHICLAGALGEHVPAEDMEALGFVPHGAGKRMLAVGNTSLRGAELLALHPGLRDELARWSRTCRLLNLAEQADFTETYLHHMRFSQP